jgi:hypothetical protein
MPMTADVDQRRFPAAEAFPLSGETPRGPGCYAVNP